MPQNAFNTLKPFQTSTGKSGQLYSLPALAESFPNVKRLPVSLRIVLESVLRNVDGKKITEAHVKQLASWQCTGARTDEIPFVLARILLQDFTGVPVLADLAAMRSVAGRMGKNPKAIEPLAPVDLVVDHSVQIDHYGAPNVLDLNMKLEFQRNRERYQFMKWGMQAFDTFKVVPPGIGIVHQVNLEYLARGVFQKAGVYYPDTLVGTDSHTTMINGIGVVAWGVGGIEAEAGMLGQPVYFLTPDVVGVNLKGKLREGVLATDLVLSVTEMLRKATVVGKFVDFFGEGAAALSVTDRATIANMAPEYGATMGFFPVDEKTVEYFRYTGRSADQVAFIEAYFKAQGMFGIPKAGEIDYSQALELDLDTVRTSLAGPKRPQDRIELGSMKSKFSELFAAPVANNGFAKKADDLPKRFKTRDGTVDIGSGDVMIAAITSCTNTSNPSVLLGAGILAKKAVEKGLTVKPHVKTSLAPGSRVVTEYLKAAGLLQYLEKLNFYVSGYGCTTCIGNAGPLAESIDLAISDNDLVCCAVLSGNRNFEARIHPNLRANFLASPPLVVAYAIAGTVLKDLEKEPLGQGKDGPVYLRDIWPTSHEIADLMKFARDPATFSKLYGDFTKDNPMWQQIPTSTGQVYNWPKSTYIAEPPFFNDFGMSAGRAHDIKGARVLGIFGDSVTTDHISPAGSIKESSPAGQYLIANGVTKADFNSYGARRGNHEVMMRGTFANVRIKNLMLPPKADGTRVEGGVTLFQPSGEQMFIYDAAMKYIGQGTPTVVFAGEEYGTGSSRDWAAKGSQLLGVKAVVARSFERIHRSNLVGMGVLPLQFYSTDSVDSLGIKGDEVIDVVGIEAGIKPQMDAKLVIRRKDGSTKELDVLVRIDTPIEVDYYLHGGILPFVLRDLMASAKTAKVTA